MIDNILLAIWFAFLGGILLNCMPCVLPVLSLKLIALVDSVGSKNIRSALFYTLGIVIAFLILGITMLILKNAGEEIGWGYHMQSPVFVTILVYVLFSIGLMLSGYLVISGSWMGIGEKYTRLHGVWGEFFTGLLIVLVSTPCSVPFMAPAVGYAISRSGIEMILILEAMGLGIAFPYLLVSFMPFMHKFIPKPGKWMETFKEFMAFPMYGSVLWLLYVLHSQSGIKYVMILMVVLLMLVMCIWLLKNVIRLTARIVIMCILVLICYMPFYFDNLNNALQYKEFSTVKLEEVIEQHKGVFVYATADWCLTCKYNEINVLQDKKFINFIKENDIIVMKADWTNKNKEISAYLDKFGASGVPHYTLYNTRGESKILPQILTVNIIDDMSIFYNAGYNN